MSTQTQTRAPLQDFVRVQATRVWSLPNFGELWAFRDLVVMIALRDLRVRYKQTALGVFWVILQPLLTSGIFTIIFGRLANLQPDGNVDYLVFANVGTVIWVLFENSVARASHSLLFGMGIISKVYFPRIVLPVASVLSGLIDFLIAFWVTILLLLLYHVPITPRMLLMPVIILGILLLAISVGMSVSALSIRRRDLLTALPFLLKMAMYSVPVVYSITLIPENWLMLYKLNPLVGFVLAAQWSMLNLQQPFPLSEVAYSVILTIVLFLASSLLYRRVERNAVDTL
ncbi:MAG: ABC transporter permease [Anaerolineae bacterium]|nr:ABC transporter permease [Anaerolineae bacterium]